MLAAGLHLGGPTPARGHSEHRFFLNPGDALRNVLFDLRLPLFALVGYRNYLVPNSPDTARLFTEPVLAGAWGLDYIIVDSPAALASLRAHFHACQAAGRPGGRSWAEGKG